LSGEGQQRRDSREREERELLSDERRREPPAYVWLPSPERPEVEQQQREGQCHHHRLGHQSHRE
jgi:hypothetical protein